MKTVAFRNPNAILPVLRLVPSSTFKGLAFLVASSREQEQVLPTHRMERGHLHLGGLWETSCLLRYCQRKDPRRRRGA